MLVLYVGQEETQIGPEELAEAELDKAKLAFITEALGASDPFAENLTTESELVEVIDWIADNSAEGVNRYRLEMTSRIEEASLVF